MWKMWTVTRAAENLISQPLNVSFKCVFISKMRLFHAHMLLFCNLWTLDDLFTSHARYLTEATAVLQRETLMIYMNHSVSLLISSDVILNLPCDCGAEWRRSCRHHHHCRWSRWTERRSVVCQTGSDPSCQSNWDTHTHTHTHSKTLSEWLNLHKYVSKTYMSKDQTQTSFLQKNEDWEFCVWLHKHVESN